MAGVGVPVTVAVLGSCITRDNFNTRFNAEYKQWYKTVLMQNQSSIISLMSPPSPIGTAELGTGTEYDLWNVRTDFSKEFLTELGRLTPDYLILDFFGDVHFGVLDLGGGRYVTDNRWKLHKTPYYTALQSSGPRRTLRLERDTDEYLALWQDAFDRLVAHVAEAAPQTTVIVHRGHNTKTLRLQESGRVVELQQHRNLARIDVARYNQLWRQLDDYACDSTGFARIDLTAREYPSPEVHPWGPYYVHYSMDYYADFLAELNRLHLERVLADRDPVLQAMLTQLLTRMGERAAADSERQEATIASQRARIKKQADRIRALETEAPRVLARKAIGKLRKRLH
jgi:hypothetical protein